MRIPQLAAWLATSLITFSGACHAYDKLVEKKTFTLPS